MITLTEFLQPFVNFLHTEKNYSSHTLKSYERDILSLAQSLSYIEDINTQSIQKIVMMKNSEGKSAKTIKRFVSSIRAYSKYVREHHTIQMPILDIIFPKETQKLPKTMSYEEVKFMIDSTFGYPEEVRDKAIIALLYSAALRVSELTLLDINDIDFKEGFIKVWGKGSKHRFTPISELPLELIREYLAQSADAATKAVFKGNRGGRITPRAVQLLVKRRAQLCDFDFNVYPHMFRHSAASHFLQSSSSIRMTQDYLGHKHITSTQVYTHLDVMKLAKVYDKAHPHQKKTKNTS